MAEVEIYTTMFCPYCTRARNLLERKGAAFTEIDIIEEPARRAEMMARPARVRMRRRKPWVFARRRLFGWYVRLLTSGLRLRLRRGSRPAP